MRFKEFCDVLVQLPLTEATEVVRYVLILALRRGLGNVLHLQTLRQIEDAKAA